MSSKPVTPGRLSHSKFSYDPRAAVSTSEHSLQTLPGFHLSGAGIFLFPADYSAPAEQHQSQASNLYTAFSSLIFQAPQAPTEEPAEPSALNAFSNAKFQSPSMIIRKQHGQVCPSSTPLSWDQLLLVGVTSTMMGHCD